MSRLRALVWNIFEVPTQRYPSSRDSTLCRLLENTNTTKELGITKGLKIIGRTGKNGPKSSLMFEIDLELHFDAQVP